MLGFVVRRVALSLVVLLGLSLAGFCFFARYGQYLKGHPVLPEYWRWLKGVFTGASLAPLHQHSLTRINLSGGPTMEDATGHTAILLALAFVFVLVFALGLALLAASCRGSIVDLAFRAFSYLAWGVPAFLLALLVQKAMNGVGGPRGIGPFPLAGWAGSCPAALGIDYGTLTNCPAAGTGLTYVGNVLRYVTVPAAVLAAGFVGLHGRYLRSALLATLDAPFVTTARAKGLAERGVLIRHALRASLATFVSVVLSDFGAVFGAAMAVDWIFELNGLGTVLISEFPLNSDLLSERGTINVDSMVLVLLIAAALVLVSALLAEVAVASLDPRSRAES